MVLKIKRLEHDKENHRLLAWGERTHFGEQLGEGYAVVSFFGIGGNATTDVNLKFSEIAHRYNMHNELVEALEEIASLLEEDSFENDEEAIEIARAVLAKEKSDK